MFTARMILAAFILVTSGCVSPSEEAGKPSAPKPHKPTHVQPAGDPPLLEEKMDVGSVDAAQLESFESSHDYLTLTKCASYPISKRLLACLKMKDRDFRKKSDDFLEQIFEISARLPASDVYSKFFVKWESQMHGQSCDRDLESGIREVLKSCTQKIESL